MTTSAEDATTEAADGLTDETVQWGFRLLAGRDPLNEAERAAFRALPDLDAMRRAFTNTSSFHAFFDAVLTGRPVWTMPLFLLRPPEDGTAWRFAPPDLDQPGSQLCTRAQFDEPAFLEIATAMGFRPAVSRAQWEQVWAASVLATEGLIRAGRRVLLIESGSERLGALLASRDVLVTATGSAASPRAAELRRTQLFYPEVIRIEDFDRFVAFAQATPADISGLPGGFDACVSFGLPTRLGSTAAALDAFEASLAPLRPGGIALHSFAFNLTSDTRSWELPNLVILRRSDIEALATRLHAAGHRLLPLNLHPGVHPEDEQVTTEVGAVHALRQRHGFLVATSFGLAIRKAG
ncbi:hypothetical protein [Falsiroseomonas oryziterrae]|uniref:hypothetical protein n=1 Tax=Falsiroseomonas oryziterrae TaxID=2911368 RepID=UPI001F287C59|nr:hypothetical protein [Roseomonas sp. NPKOSM-4]